MCLRTMSAVGRLLSIGKNEELNVAWLKNDQYALRSSSNPCNGWQQVRSLHHCYQHLLSADTCSRICCSRNNIGHCNWSTKLDMLLCSFDLCAVLCIILLFNLFTLLMQSKKGLWMGNYNVWSARQGWATSTGLACNVVVGLGWHLLFSFTRVEWTPHIFEQCCHWFHYSAGLYEQKSGQFNL